MGIQIFPHVVFKGCFCFQFSIDGKGLPVFYQFQIGAPSDHGIMSQFIHKGGIQKCSSRLSLVDPENLHCRDIWGQFFYDSLIIVHVFTPVCSRFYLCSERIRYPHCTL